MEITFIRNSIENEWDITPCTLGRKIQNESGIDEQFFVVCDEANGIVNYPDYELTQQEQNTINSIIEASRGVNDDPPLIGEKKYRIKKYTGNRQLKKETWYHTDNGDGTYADKVEEIIYHYSNKKLTGFTINKYWMNGDLRETEEYEYYQNIIEEESMVILKKVEI